MRNAPCYKCEKRSAGCHADCKLYRIYYAWRRRKIDIETEERYRENAVITVRINGIQKLTRKKSKER